MNLLAPRARLLAGTVVGAGVALLLPQQAMAACSYSGGTYTCATTTTTDTVYVIGTLGPVFDRTITFPANPAGTNVNLVVTSGAVVDGYGLALTTVGTDGPFLHVTNNGSITVNAGNTPTTGGSPAALSIVSNGTNIDYVGSGSVRNLGTGQGIYAATAEDSTINLNIGGAVSSVTSNAIETLTDTGSQVITIGGAVSSGQNGILATATTGTITVNINANVTRTTAGDVVATVNDGASVVTVQAGRTVVGTTGDVINFYGNGANATLNNSGTIGNATSGRAVFTGINKGVTVNNLAGGVINGNYDLSDLNDTINNSGTLNVRGVNNFYAGTDSLANSASGVVNTVTGTSFTNFESITNAGTVNVAGTLTFSGVATTLTNSGTLNLNTATVTGLGAVTNSGTIRAESGANGITATSLANSGTIDLADGAANDVLTITGNYTGSGGANLLIDASSTATDLLVITGSASGTTSVGVSPVGNLAFNTTGQLVVDTGTSTANAFVIGTPTVGLFNFRIAQIGQDYFLITTPSVAAFEVASVGNVAQDMWYQSADIYTGYAALRRTDVGAQRKNGIGFWAQLYMSRDKYGDNQSFSAFGNSLAINTRMETNRRGAQVGVDYLVGDQFVVGLTGGYQHARADYQTSVTSFDADGYNFGGYLLYGGATGLHAGLLVKHDKADIRMRSPLFATATNNPNEKSLGAEGEVGFGLTSGTMQIDLTGGLAYVRSKIDDFGVGTIAFDIDTVKSLRGRLGVRVGLGGQLGPYVDAKVLHEFKGDTNLHLTSAGLSTSFEGAGRGTWGRVEAGIGSQKSGGGIIAAWAEFGDVKGIGARLGFRF
jgi:outer membrane autotransporter protein